MAMEHMSDAQYWDVIRSIHYLFSKSAVNYARGYLKAAQKRYYEKKKEAICARMKERYENDEEYRQMRIARVKLCQANKKRSEQLSPVF